MSAEENEEVQKSYIEIKEQLYKEKWQNAKKEYNRRQPSKEEVFKKLKSNQSSLSFSFNRILQYSFK